MSTTETALTAHLVRTASGSNEDVSDTPFYRPAAQAAQPATRHRDGISSFMVVRDVALPRAAFSAWLDMVIAMRGEDLLRVKGLVHLADEPDRPMVIHGVQHLFAPPQFLAAWPSPDRRTRIVFITRGVDAESLDETLDVMVRRHIRRDGPGLAGAPP